MSPFLLLCADPLTPRRADSAFTATIARIPSRFFTLDVAQRHDGSWMIVELGDGQVAGLPPATDVSAFYRRLAAHLDY